jgi:hypothetical protein
MRSRHLAIALALATLISAAAMATGTASLRCGSRVVQGGDTSESVRSKCGDPAGISHQTLFRRPSLFYGGRFFFSSDELVAVPVEIWTYNFGPRKLMHRLKFVDGILEEVESMSYGYHDDR